MVLMRRHLTLVLALAMGGCASTAAIAPPPKVVKQAVATSCVPKDMAGPPKIPFSKADLKQAASPDQLMKELYADLVVMWPRFDLDEGVIDACR